MDTTATMQCAGVRVRPYRQASAQPQRVDAEVSVSDELHHDESWLQAYRRGESTAMARVYERYAPELQRMLRRGLRTRSADTRIRLVIRNEDERAEIVQEVFARAFSDSARRSYKGVAPYFPFLRRICRNVIVDRHRASKRARTRMVSDVQKTASGEYSRIERTGDDTGALFGLGRNPERSVLHQQIADALEGFVSELGEDEQRLVRLYYQDPISQRDAAAEMGVDRNRVRALVSGIRGQLLAYMRREGLIESLDPQELMEIVERISR